MKNSTSKQQRDVADFLAAFSGDHGRAPSTREIMTHFGIRNSGSVEWVLKKLKCSGLISPGYQTDRAFRWSEDEISILSANYSALGADGCLALIPRMNRRQIKSQASIIGAAKRIASDVDRFHSRIRITPGCWIWTGSKFDKGYGQFNVDGKNWQAHRYSYTHYFDAIPPGMCVCHKCDNPPCVNPDHLFLGTHQDNADDRIRKGRLIPLRLGEDHHLSKLTNSDVMEIRRAVGTQSEIGAKFGICASNVSFIKSRKTWRHVVDASSATDV